MLNDALQGRGRDEGGEWKIIGEGLKWERGRIRGEGKKWDRERIRGGNEGKEGRKEKG